MEQAFYWCGRVVNQVRLIDIQNAPRSNAKQCWSRLQGIALQVEFVDGCGETQPDTFCVLVAVVDQPQLHDTGRFHQSVRGRSQNHPYELKRLGVFILVSILPPTQCLVHSSTKPKKSANKLDLVPIGPRTSPGLISKWRLNVHSDYEMTPAQAGHFQEID